MGLFFTKDIAVLDVTSRLISVIIGTKRAQSVFGIKSIVEKAHQGYENGEWFDKEDTLQVAKDTLIEGMKGAASRTKRLFISVPAEFCTVMTKEVSITLDRHRKVGDDDVAYLLKSGNVFDADNYVTINTSAIYFAIDNVDKLFSDVRGMEATRIEACVSYMLCEKSYVEMFDGLASALGFNDVRYISSAWAECMSLFEKEQRDNAYVLVDIGYLSSSVSIAKGEGILELKSFSMGGAHISADIFEALEVPFELAEDAKRLVDINLNYADDAVLVGNADYSINASDACEIAKARIDVFADIIAEILDDVELSYLPIYLTGEGIAPMRGAKKYLSEQLGKNIEIVTPKLPGFVKPDDSSKTSLLIVADTLSHSGVGDYIKRLFNGGKK